MGGMDLVRAAGLAGLRCAVVTRPGDTARFSRFSRATLEWSDPWTRPAELLDTLIRFGSTQAERPVLFYDEDGHLALLSRHRQRLARSFRFLLPDAEIVEDLIDKARFQRLAERLELPIPRGRSLPTSGPPPQAADLDLRFPLLLKAVTHRTRSRLDGQAKALRVESAQALREVWPLLADAGPDVVAQELVPGPETAIESYHVYVDAAGATAGEFTGRKIRTRPATYGVSSALTITDSADVARLGRDMTARLGLRGVAKIDFKRAPDGTLVLLEVNPRFSLWAHLGAKAGVNLPELQYRDLVGLPRPVGRRARAGTRWCHRRDLEAARQQGMSPARWLRWAIACEAKSGVAWDDPMPFLRGVVWPRLRRRWRPSASTSDVQPLK